MISVNSHGATLKYKFKNCHFGSKSPQGPSFWYSMFYFVLGGPWFHWWATGNEQSHLATSKVNCVWTKANLKSADMGGSAQCTHTPHHSFATEFATDFAHTHTHTHTHTHCRCFACCLSIKSGLIEFIAIHERTCVCVCEFIPHTSVSMYMWMRVCVYMCTCVCSYSWVCACMCMC